MRFIDGRVLVINEPPCLAALEQAAADAPPSQVAHLDLAVARAPQVLQLRGADPLVHVRHQRALTSGSVGTSTRTQFGA